jgi:prepilin-type N-terminal cleavage/methylation domain-containing protein
MKNSPPRLKHSSRAFTLVELLVVIAIIAILAGLILPTVLKSIERGRIVKAQTQIAQMVQAINSYHSQYSIYPVSSDAVSTAAATGGDFTYGGTALANALGPGSWTTANSEVIAILMDLENDGFGKPTINNGHVKNTQRIKLLPAKMVSNANEPGVGPDLVYRDPWGNPYIISVDLNYDERCKDAFYCQELVSQQAGPTGFNGLVNATDPGGEGDNFRFNGGVMVWSLGPDRQADKGQRANAAPNKDNILSWK